MKMLISQPALPTISVDQIAVFRVSFCLKANRKSHASAETTTVPARTFIIVIWESKLILIVQSDCQRINVKLAYSVC